MNENEIGETVLGAALKVHSAVGPGLLEGVYETCLVHKLSIRGLYVKRQVPFPVRYEGVELDAALRADLVVNDSVIVELKSIEKILPVHLAQLLSYLKLSGFRLGYLLNFNVVHMRDGIKRVVNGL